MHRPSYRLAQIGVFSLLVGTLVFAPGAFSQANVQGQWQTLPYTMPINPIHAALMPNGKVLVVAGSGNLASNSNFQAAVWDPQAGTVTTQAVTWDMFCNGMVVLPDGRPFIVGGTLQYDPFYGSPRGAIYDPATGAFTDSQMMADGRWYPTATVLGDGRIMVFSGTNETGGTNTSVEIYSVGSGWSPAHAAPWTPPLYPRLHLLPNGKVFYSGPTTTSSLFDPSTNTWTTNYARTNSGSTRTYGSSVLLPLTPANNYKPKVMIFGGGNPSTATTEIIDLSAATPTWVAGPNMSAQRIEMNATLLPNGTVLTLGGSFNDEDLATAALNADLYDPVSNTFTSAGTEAFARLYHSVSVLMPDGRVWVAGGNPSRGTYEPHMEIYSPAYLFNPNGSLATRPSITSMSSSKVGYGSAFTVQTPDAANISSVVLMRNGAPTHAFDMEQRYVGLSFTAGSGVLSVTGPPNGNIAPPGYYMLFLVSRTGVPSVASMVQVSAAPGDAPPSGTITSPAGNVTIAAGQSITYAGSGADSDGSISSYFWNFQGGTPSTSNLANPGSVTYSTPGTYVTTLTVKDNQGVTDPHPPTRTVTVTGPPDFTLTATPSLQSVAQGGTTSYTTQVAGTNNFSATVSLNVSGLPTGATASFNPTTITNSGSSTLRVTTSASTPTGVFTLTITASGSGITHTDTVALIVSQSGGATAINFGGGFSGSGLQFNGHTSLNESRLQLTDGTSVNQASSAFWTTPVSVQSFSNVFTFQLLNPSADGFTFTIQNAGVTALGSPGGGLGYGKFGTATAAIAKSVAVKFDLFSNSGEGTNSTGLYINGASPTVPATNLTGGINLHSGNILLVQMTYDGTTLRMTITDTTAPSNTFTTSWPINIPATVGGNTAFVGFTGGTGGQTATQQILAWTYGTNSDFSVGVTPSSDAVTQGGSTPYTAMVTGVNGFTGSVALSVTGLPAGASASFNPASVSGSGTSTMTVTTASTTPTGSYTLTISGKNGSVTRTATAALIVTKNTGPATVDFGSGFTTSGLQFNGHTKLNGTRLQLTDTTSTSQAASAFWTTPVNVQSFTNAFTFQLTNPNADGFTFVIQNAGLTALGSPGGGLGYGKFATATAAIAKSVAVKFDLYSNSGEGTNSTGLYTNGVAPTLPATALGGGVNLHSGDVFQAQMSYDGTTLTMTITDASVPANTFTTSFPINIPATVGGNTAFVGFTGGTGGQTAIQEILNWTYTAGSGAPTPDFLLATSPASQSVTQGGSTSYTATVTATNGFSGTVALSAIGLPAGATASFNPTSITGSGASTMTISTTGSTPVGSNTVTVSATSGALTHTSQVTLTVAQSGGNPTVNFGTGFTAGGLQLNGHTRLNGTRLQLTDTTSTSQAASAFWTTPVNVQSFTNTFTFQLTSPNADGFTFTIQNAGVTALGSPGGGLGYGKFATATAAIAKSVAVKFDLYSNSGEGTNSTGLYTNGSSPTVPATTLGGGVNLHSGDIFQVQMSYDGATLTMTITDTTVPANSFTTSFPINIPATVGGNTAFVGFTGATGGQTATQEILTWTYNATPNTTPDFSVGASPASQSVTQGSSTPYAVTITPTNGFTGAVSLSVSGLPSGATASFNPTLVTTSGSSTLNVTTASSTPTGVFTLSVTGTSGSLSHSTTVSLAVAQSGGSSAINFGSGFTAGGLQLNGHARLNGTRLQLTDTTSTNQAASAFWTTPVNVQRFTNTFTFQLTSPNADGFTFTIQNAGVTALGSPGAGLGYGKFSTLTASIPKSVAVKFDLFSNSGEGTNSTGLYTNGSSPTLPATTLGGGVNLHSGAIFQVQMSYDGTTLTMTITDTTTPANTFTTSFPINIAATVGGNVAFVGFTGGTGGQTATQEILNWTFSNPL